MKKLILPIVLMFFVLQLTGCSTSIASVKVEEVKDIIVSKIGNDKTETSNYQGYIIVNTNMSTKDKNNLKKVTVKNIKFSENKNGEAIMFRYNAPLNKEGINVAYKDIRHKDYEYTKEMFDTLYGFKSVENNQYATKLQYIIAKVDPKVAKKDLKRTASFTMVYEINDGKKVNKIEKPVNIQLFKD